MNASAAPITYDPREGHAPLTFVRSFPEELRQQQKSPHESESPWARVPPASASKALLEIGSKIFSAAEKQKMQGIEQELATLDLSAEMHGNAAMFDEQIWHLDNDEASNELTIEERVNRRRALESARADIPTWLRQIDEKGQRLTRELVPFALRLLKALAARIDSELRDIEKNGVGGRNDFWEIGGTDKKHFLYPICRLADFTAGEIAILEAYRPENGSLVRSRLIDCGAITQLAKLNR
jgi:hypothetical protein